MKPTLYLHIGAAKSGSSAIQAALRANREALRRRGYLVPAVDLGARGYLSSGGHVAYFEMLRPISEDAVRSTAERLAQLRAHAEANRLASVVVSAENLINIDDFARLFEGAQQDFAIQVVAYVRRQDDYAIAVWNQWHFKANPNFRDWTARLPAGLGDWDELLRRWEQALPAATFRVRVFERGRLAGGDVARDFLGLLGVDPDGLRLDSTPVNRSLGDLAMRVAQRNRHLFTDAQDHRFLEFLRAVGGEKAFESYGVGLYFTPEERRAFLERFAASNERLRQRHFPETAPGALFERPSEVTEPAATDVEAIEHELDLVWSALFRHWGRSGAWATRARIQDLAWNALFTLWGASRATRRRWWSAPLERLRGSRTARR